MIEIPEETRREWSQRSFAERSHPPSKYDPPPRLFSPLWWRWKLDRLIGEA